MYQNNAEKVIEKQNFALFAGFLAENKQNLKSSLLEEF